MENLNPELLNELGTETLTHQDLQDIDEAARDLTSNDVVGNMRRNMQAARAMLVSQPEGQYALMAHGQIEITGVTVVPHPNINETIFGRTELFYQAVEQEWTNVAPVNRLVAELRAGSFGVAESVALQEERGRLVRLDFMLEGASLAAGEEIGVWRLGIEPQRGDQS